MKRPIFILLLILGFACQDHTMVLSDQNPEQLALFTELSPEESGIDFSNPLPENLKYNGLQYEYYYNGSGLAVTDFNNDGLEDIFFVSALGRHGLYLNMGHLNFMDASKFTGILPEQHFSGGVTVVDINNDGWMDIYLSNSGRFNDPEKRKNKLYINQGARGDQKIPTFKEASKSYGLDFSDCSTQAAFFDYDKDGDLDMYLMNHFPTTYPVELTLKDMVAMDGGVANDRLLRNDNGTFTDISKMAGINHSRLEYGLGIGISDINNDGWPDIYISTDYSGSDHLYLNNRNGTFSDRILEATKHTSFFAMGNDLSDINNDGWTDIMAVDMMGANNYDIKTSMSGMNPKNFQETVSLGLHHQYMYNSLQINTGPIDDTGIPHFKETAQFSGIDKTDWSWGPLIFDMDNDGHKDLFISNGIKRDFRNNDFVNYVNGLQDSIHQNKKFDTKAYVDQVMARMPERKKPNYFFRNTQNLRFKNMNGVWGPTTPTCSNGAIYSDLDLDGDLDIILNNTTEKAVILKNHSVDLKLGHFLSIALEGSPDNKNGIGTKVWVTTKDGVQKQELYNSHGFMSAKGNRIHFGLGKNEKAELKIEWPDGNTQTLSQVMADRPITLKYTDARPSTKPTDIKQTYYTAAQIEGLNYRHRENEFNDYDRESLLPHTMSNHGPAMAAGDVNGDGLEDIFLGAAKGMTAKIFIQQQSNRFLETKPAVFEPDAVHEDETATFFDADQDGDLDLYVGSGGNESPENADYYLDRLYINNGKGEFTEHQKLPKIRQSTGTVRAADFDQDGDLDLFVGIRQIPGKYGASPKSYLLENQSNAGKISFEVNPLFKHSGMVTDAAWQDLTGDGRPDLVVVGEWSKVSMYQNTIHGFNDISEKMGLSNTTGWWNCVEIDDIDQDGDFDIIAGNLGQNYKYKASKTEPFSIYASDFDGNGTHDIVLGYYDKETLFPVRGRECSSNQMPFIKKKFPTYDAFGKAKITDIFTADQLDRAYSAKATTFTSTVFLNDDGKFRAVPLPEEAQLSSVNTMLISDVDQDGNKDLLLAGNLLGSEVETPRNDGSYGTLLLGLGNGQFKTVPNYESGIFVEGETKHIQNLKVSNSLFTLFIRNNDSIAIFKPKDR